MIVKNIYTLQPEDFQNKIVVYPTDTLWGIGCDATNDNLIERIRTLKKTTNNFSVIVPSMEWIEKNCVLNDDAREWLQKLPGPYTIVLPLKNMNAVGMSVTSNMKIGVRIPDHWIKNVIRQYGKPLITTSANRHNEQQPKTIDDISFHIMSQVDLIVEEDVTLDTPSKVIDCSDESYKVLRD
ncbi:threonylcarbamoyl-AMP synthase [Candidatus Woesearchaeota archaeon]|nr:threonylcarbamoyl-AMP synthase [Candidatus Woesearchaeota archaeon]